MGTVQPTGLIIVPAADLDTAVARVVAVRLETQAQDKVTVLLFREQPNVIMLLASHGISEDRSVLHPPELLAGVGRLALDHPTG